MSTLRSTLSKHINNTTQKFDGLVTKPTLKNMRGILVGMILAKSCHLIKIGDLSSNEITPRKNTERYSRALANIDTEACHKEHIKCTSFKFKNEPVLILGDGGDMQKKHAKKMDLVCGNVDGSNGHKTGKGYYTFGVMAYGTESKKVMPLAHHLYSTKSEDFKSQWFEQKKCYEWCAPFLNSNYDRIHIEDRGGDDTKRFLFFTKEQKASFITRINTDKKCRHLCPVKNGEIRESISVKAISDQCKKRAGASKNWENKKLNKELTSNISWQEVRLPNHNDLPLYMVMVYTEVFEEPLVVLTDIEVKDFESAWKIFFWYKKRWEVENFFRAIKQQFDAEKFLIRNFKAIRGLAFMQMIAYSGLCTLHEKMESNSDDLLIWYEEYCKQWQKNKSKPLSFLQWIREVFKLMPALHSHRYYAKEIYNHHLKKNRDQLRLFSIQQIALV